MGVANGIVERLADALESVPLRNKLLVLCRPPALSRAFFRHHRGLTATADRMPASGLNGRFTSAGRLIRVIAPSPPVPLTRSSRKWNLRELRGRGEPERNWQSNWRKRTESAGGFTLLELLIVIAIISLIVSIMIPAVQSARESSRRVECQNNLRQFGIAFANHEAARKHFPAGLRVWVNGPLIDLDRCEFAFHGFMPDLLPYLEQQQVADQYNVRKMYAAPENAAAASTVLPVTLCPSAVHGSLIHEDEFRPGELIQSGITHLELEHGSSLPGLQSIIQHIDNKYSGSSKLALSDYAGVAIVSPQLTQAIGASNDTHHPFGLNGMFPFPVYDAETLLAFQRSLLQPKEATLQHPMQTNAVIDGLSNTIMLVETAGRPQFWDRGRLSDVTAGEPAGWANPRSLLLYEGAADCAVNCSNHEAIYSFHGDIAYVLFVDGHVQALSASGTDARVLVALLTPNWGGAVALERESD